MVWRATNLVDGHTNCTLKPTAKGQFDRGKTTDTFTPWSSVVRALRRAIRDFGAVASTGLC
jgi:hypothetical protein